MDASDSKPIQITKLLGSSDAFILEVEINRMAATLARVYVELPPCAKADAISIGHSLAAFQRKIKALQDKHAKKCGVSYLENRHHKAA